MNPVSLVPSEIHAIEEARVYAKVTGRLLPFLFFFYIVAYLDRVNIGFAKLQMLSDLHWTDTIYGFGAGMFFIGYFVFELPSNLILYKLGAREWMATIMVVWGLLSVCMMFVASPTWFYLLRFFLGVAEAGFFPGIVLYLTYWYPGHRRGQVIAILMTAISVAGIVGGPLSGWIMQRFNGFEGLRGWQWLFVLEGFPAVLMGGLVLVIFDDSIRQAKWLTENEKQLLEKNLADDHRPGRHTGIRQVVTDPRVWLWSLILFLLIMGLYAIGFWLPQLIANTGVKSVLEVGLLSAIPYVAATVFMIWLGRRSDRMGERHIHIAVSAFIGGLGLIFSGVFAGETVLSLAALTVATSAIFATIPIMVTLPTEFLSGIAAAAGIGLINSFGNLAGFASPYLVGAIKDATHSLSIGLYFVAGCLFLAGAILIISRPRKP